MVTLQNVDLLDDVLEEPFNATEAVKVFSEISKELTDTHITIIFVDERLIRQLNSDYREKDESTDVLSFTPPFPEIEVLESDGDDPLGGEIYVCPKYIVDQLDDRYGNYEEERLLEEVFRMIIHGILHLSGWDHDSIFEYESNADDIEPMFMQQEAILEKYRNQLRGLLIR